MASAPNDEVYTKDIFSGAVAGGPELEKTQIYPIEFGEAALCMQIVCNTIRWFIINLLFVALYVSRANAALILSFRLQQRTCNAQGLHVDLKMQLDGGT